MAKIYNIGTATQSAFRQYATFRGRAARDEFWWFSLAQILASIFAIIIVSPNGHVEDSMLPLFFIFFIGIGIPSIAAQVRRLHDTGRSGWNLLWYLLLPPLGSFVVLFLLVGDSDGPNKYGDPK